ncbi:MAG: 4Fe-4S dicluster domain-containing protein [Myxococcales bacterium]|nr:4Fe-4S dicluster domain-containing protein [Myxococcales bacterium]
MTACIDPDDAPLPLGQNVVATIPERCRRCYTCVRECPAKAIRVENGQATVLQERCIACGNCVRVCAQQAKRIVDCVPRVERMLADRETPTFACLAPSFPAAFHPTRPGKLVAAIRALGFAEVWEVALGAELVGRAYSRLAERSAASATQLISSACPALVSFVQKHMPSLLGTLAPIVSPMIATARAIRKRRGAGVRVVFIGPCIAKKNEFRDPLVNGEVDAVLTFEELRRMLFRAGIVPEHMTETFFDSPRCDLGRSFPLSGGLLKTAGLRADILENDIVVTEGKDRVLGALEAVANGSSDARLFDILFCEGCINGPLMPQGLSPFMRKEVVAAFVTELGRRTTQREVVEAIAEFDDLDLSRTFQSQVVVLPQPSEVQIAAALRRMKKGTPEDRLDCGACGYPTCREKAIAVCQGLAEPEMCLPYLVDELQAVIHQLRVSHDELASAQQRLVHSEKLASMGQLSAGVAHEINNPLGVVLLYSHILAKQLPEGDPRRSDIDVIVREATRCRNIVRGLLDFARQSRVQKTPTDTAQLFQEVAGILQPRLEGRPVRFVMEVEPGLPVMLVDATQIKQMLVNLLENGLDAIQGAGELRLCARCIQDGRTLEIKVTDSGCGIPAENLPKLFTPFFTTKEAGKGTGLGLAIAYGVVKMHCGDITADSEVGRGTTFRITLPIEQPVTEAVAAP